MPGFNQDTIRATPVLELYAAGTRFRKALDTLVRQAATGRVLPEDVDAFLADKPTLEKADAWLSQAVSKRTVGLEALLDSSGPTLILDALGTRGGPLVGRVTTDEEAGALRSYLQKLTGMDDEWLSFAMGDPRAPILDRIEWDRVPNRSQYPFNIPAIREIQSLLLDRHMTFFAGENGCGKSTLVEAIAVAAGFNAEGGSRNFNFATRATESNLHRVIRLVRDTERVRGGFFLRAETLYNVATWAEREQLAEYGWLDLHTISHGEMGACLESRLRPSYPGSSFAR